MLLYHLNLYVFIQKPKPTIIQQFIKRWGECKVIICLLLNPGQRFFIFSGQLAKDKLLWQKLH